jgi:hypothetical protein
MHTRKELLQHLAEYVLPIEPVLAELSQYPFDSDLPLFTVSRNHVLAVLDRYATGELTPEQVTDWADLIECRDDLDFEDVSSGLLRDTVFQLANPNLTQPVSPHVASAIRQRIQEHVS